MENFMIVFSVLLYVFGFSITIFILDFFLRLLTDRDEIKK